MRQHLSSISELARLLTELGYMAEAREVGPGSYTLVKRNCPLCAVARNHPETCCKTSAAFYQQLLGDLVVERSETILEGSRNCAFSLRHAPGCAGK